MLPLKYLNLPWEKELFPRAISPRQVGPRLLLDNSPSLARSVLFQAGSSQDSLVDSTPARSVLSQAGGPRLLWIDNTLSLARSALSQAGSSQASLVDSTPARSPGSPRQAVSRSPWEIALFHRQRVHSPRQAILRLPQEKTLSHQQRVSSPRAVSPLPQRIALSRQRVLHLLRQSGTWQGLGLGRQATPLGRSVRSLSKTVLFPRGYSPGQCFPRGRVLPL